MPEIDAGMLPQDAVLECDVCIIGAGAAGITVAHRLLKTTKKVLLLESSLNNIRTPGAEEQKALVRQRETTSAPDGQQPRAGRHPDDHRFEDPATQPLYIGEPGSEMGSIDKSFLTRSRIRVFGGTTNCWGGWTRTLSPIDFNRSEIGELNVWPITFDDLYRSYQDALVYCSLASFDPHDYDDPQAWVGRTSAPIAVLPQKTGMVRTGVFSIMNGDGPKVDGALDFQIVWGPDLVDPQSNVTLVRNANVRSLDSSGSHVIGVMAQSIDRTTTPVSRGKRFFVKAKQYVVAAGGIETVRLLLLSKPGGLGNGSRTLGSYFMVHPLNTNAGWVELKRRPPDDVYNFYTGWPKLTNTPWPPSIFASFVPTDEAMRKGKIGNYRMLVNFSSGGFNLNWEQMPNPDSRITLSTTKKDLFDDAQVELDWQTTGKEEETAGAAMKAVVDELVALGYTDAQETTAPPIAQPGDHHMGASRMSADPRNGYVDANCKSHEIFNLYIASPSVFSTGGVSNPTLTLIALAARLGDHLKAM